MTPVDQQQRQYAIRRLVTLALWEVAVLAAVIAAFFMTNSVIVLVGGVLASTALFAPMFLNWVREHGQAVKAKPNSIEGGNG